MKNKKTVDLREVLLKAAGECFLYRHITFEGKTYTGENAIRKGYDLIALTQSLERKYLYKK